MRPQTKGAGSTDIFRVNAPKIPHYPGAGLHWRDNSDYTALGPTPRPVYRVNVIVRQQFAVIDPFCISTSLSYAPQPPN